MTQIVLESRRKALAAAAHRLSAAGIEDPMLDARLLLLEAAGQTLESFWREDGLPLSAEQERRFEQLLRRRIAREPIAYILGRRGFWTLDLHVGPGVLVPRPESESVVEAVLDARRDKSAGYRILDLGTGSGCLLLSLLDAYPQAHGLGIDRSARALDYARRNAAHCGFASRAQFFCGDWASAVTASFDILVANPPYIRDEALSGLMPEIASYEPQLALAGGADGLAAYRAIAAQLRSLMAPGALCVFEIGAGQAAAVTAILAAEGLAVAPPSYDLAGHPRAISGRARGPV